MEPPAVVHDELDIAQLIKWLESENPELDPQIIDAIRQLLDDKPEKEVLEDLIGGLTIDQLKRLYSILVRDLDDEWTLYFSEHLWQAIQLKIKLEYPTLYRNPRISLILHFPGEKGFFMMLTDGSIWAVADHLKGENFIDRLIIMDLLGQYTRVEECDQDPDFTYRISALGFPEIRPATYMLANPAEFLPEADGRDVYEFGNLY